MVRAEIRIAVEFSIYGVCVLPELDEAVHLSAHDSAWRTLFELEAQRIAAVMPGVVIEHIGSTAVPGLWAKPVIDIMLGLQSSHGLEGVRARLVELGMRTWVKPACRGGSIFEEELGLR